MASYKLQVQSHQSSNPVFDSEGRTVHYLYPEVYNLYRFDRQIVIEQCSMPEQMAVAKEWSHAFLGLIGSRSEHLYETYLYNPLGVSMVRSIFNGRFFSRAAMRFIVRMHENKRPESKLIESAYESVDKLDRVIQKCLHRSVWG